MKRLTVSPVWLFQTDKGEWFEPALFRLLVGILETGKLTEAAKSAGMSYRHAWNLLNRASEIFGLPIVAMHKGQGTRLSELGEKLLWADQRVKARLGPQIDSMASEINDQIQQLLSGSHPVLRIHASHGYAIALLPEYNDQIETNLQYRNPQEALEALIEGNCDIASFHFPTCPTLAKSILSHYESQLSSDKLRLIRFVTRREGLMMRQDSHPKVTNLQELKESGLRFISRDIHSGTRILFNLLLDREGIPRGAINRTSHQEFTHTAVAACVAAGMADVGFGVEAAANQFGLTFSALAEEHYLLICREDDLNQNNVQRLIQLIESDAFIERIQSLPGYKADFPGTVTTFEQLIAENGGRSR